MSQRKLPRWETRQVVRYHVLEVDGEQLEVARLGTTLASDISLGGVFLSHAQIKPGTHVHFYFELPDGYLEAVGKVVHGQHRIDPWGVARPGAGVRFLRMAAIDRARLARYLGGKAAGHRIPETPAQLTAAD